MHATPDRADDLVAQHDVVVQRLAPQIEEAVTQAQVFRVVRLAEDGNGHFLGLREHLDLCGENFDLTGRQLTVKRTLRALAHFAVDADHPFGAHRLGDLKGGAVGIGDDLGDAVVVAQIDEKQPAMVAHAVHPARQAHVLGDVCRPQLPARMRAVAVQGACAGLSASRGRLLRGLFFCLRLSHRAVSPQCRSVVSSRGKSAWGHQVVKARGALCPAPPGRPQSRLRQFAADLSTWANSTCERPWNANRIASVGRAHAGAQR